MYKVLYLLIYTFLILKKLVLNAVAALNAHLRCALDLGLWLPPRRPVHPVLSLVYWSEELTLEEEQEKISLSRSFAWPKCNVQRSLSLSLARSLALSVERERVTSSCHPLFCQESLCSSSSLSLAPSSSSLSFSLSLCLSFSLSLSLSFSLSLCLSFSLTKDLFLLAIPY